MRPTRNEEKKLNITERKLGQRKAWGLYYHGDDKIEIDPRQKQKQYLHVLIHELLHMAFNELSEEGVERAADVICTGAAGVSPGQKENGQLQR